MKDLNVFRVIFQQPFLHILPKRNVLTAFRVRQDFIRVPWMMMTTREGSQKKKRRSCVAGLGGDIVTQSTVWNFIFRRRRERRREGKVGGGGGSNEFSRRGPNTHESCQRRLYGECEALCRRGKCEAASVGKSVRLTKAQCALHFSRRLAASQLSPSATADFQEKIEGIADFLIPNKSCRFALSGYALQLSNLRTVDAQMGRYIGGCGSGLRSNPWSRHHVFWRGREILLDCRLFYYHRSRLSVQHPQNLWACGE